MGTLATIYSVGSEEEGTIKNRMAAEVKPNGQPLLIYPRVFRSWCSMLLHAMYEYLGYREEKTNGWKWPWYNSLV